jgi:hypothetical protein
MGLRKKAPAPAPSRPEPPHEKDKVRAWRMEQLLLAGAPIELAEVVSEREDIDLHHACKVVRAVSDKGGDMLLALHVLV